MVGGDGGEKGERKDRRGRERGRERWGDEGKQLMIEQMGGGSLPYGKRKMSRRVA